MDSMPFTHTLARIALLMCAATLAHATAYNQPAVDTDPTRRLYDAGHPTQAVNLPDGGIILVGDFNEYAGVRVDGIVKLSSSGVVDLAFRPQLAGIQGRRSFVDAAAVVGEHLYVGGNFESIDGLARTNVARFSLPDLALDTTWAIDYGAKTHRAMTELDGDLVYAYTFGTPGNYTTVMHRIDIANTGTTMWSAYLYDSFDAIRSLKPTPQGDLVLLSAFQSLTKHSGTDGAQIQWFQIPTSNYVSRVEFDITPDGDVIVAGDLDFYPANTSLDLARFDGVTGTRRQDWILSSDTATGVLGTVLATPDGGAIISGDFSQVAGIPTSNGLARISAAGTVVPDWGGVAASSDSRFMHAVDSDRFIVIEAPRNGSATTIRAAVIASGTDTSASFSEAVVSRDAVVTVMQDDESNVLIGGKLQRAGDHASIGIVRLQTGLAVDPSFVTDFSEFRDPPPIRSLAAGGGFIHAQTAATHFVELNGEDYPVNQVLLASETGERIPLSPTQISPLRVFGPNPVYDPANGMFYLLVDRPSIHTPPVAHGNLLRYSPATAMVDSAWSTDASIPSAQRYFAAVIAGGTYYAGGSNFDGSSRLLRASTSSGSAPDLDWQPGVTSMAIYALATDAEQQWVYVGGVDSEHGGIR
jgi:hypothetical protein